MATVLIVVPNQGPDKDDFLNVARDAKKSYCRNAAIFSATWDGRSVGGTSFAPIDGVPSGFSKDFWESVAIADTFISLSHCGPEDGPIIGPGREQPWHTNKYEGNELADPAIRFWSRIGWGVGTGGRILIGGCDTAQTYGKLVAKIMTPNVFGFSNSIGAGSKAEMRMYIGNYFMKNKTGKNVIKC